MFGPAFNDANWQSFYGAAAQVSGGLVGLVFVGLTFHAQRLRESHNRDLQDLAVQTFQDFLQVLIISLVMLVPDMPVGGVALSMLLFSGFALVRAWLRFRAVMRAQANARGAVRLRFGLSVMGQLLLVAAGILLLPGLPPEQQANALLMIFASVMILMVSGSRSAWFLIAHELE